MRLVVVQCHGLDGPRPLLLLICALLRLLLLLHLLLLLLLLIVLTGAVLIVINVNEQPLITLGSRSLPLVQLLEVSFRPEHLDLNLLNDRPVHCRRLLLPLLLLLGGLLLVLLGELDDRL